MNKREKHGHGLLIQLAQAHRVNLTNLNFPPEQRVEQSEALDAILAWIEKKR